MIVSLDFFKHVSHWIHDLKRKVFGKILESSFVADYDWALIEFAAYENYGYRSSNVLSVISVTNDPWVTNDSVWSCFFNFFLILICYRLILIDDWRDNWFSGVYTWTVYELDINEHVSMVRWETPHRMLSYHF